MAKFNFIGGSYQSPSLNENAQVCYNLYVETDQSGAGKNNKTLLGTPGLTLLGILPTSPIRGIWAGGSAYSDASRLFVVAGSKLYEVAVAAGAMTVVGSGARGDVGNDGKPVQIFVNSADGGNQLMIVSAGAVYIDLGTGPNSVSFAAAQYKGTATATGGSTTVGWIGGDQFDSFLVGATIDLNFTPYTVASVTDSTTLELTATYAISGTADNLPYTASAAGAALTASAGAFIDGYFLAQMPQSNKFFFSAINDGTQWSPLDFGAKQGYADHTVAMLVDHELIWLFGDQTTEVWQDTGAAPPAIPFGRVAGGMLPIGCVSPWAPASLENGVAWLGADTRGAVAAWLAQGLTPVRISTYAVEAIWAGYAALNDCTTYVYQQGGHMFWVLHFPTAGATWVYDATEKMWHQRGSLIGAAQGAALGRFHAYAFKTHVVGSFNSGALYAMSNTAYNEAGAAITRIRTAPHLSNEDKFSFYSQFQLVAENTGTLNPALDWSNDGAHTFSTPRTTASQAAGTYAQYEWRRLGKARDRVFRITITAAVKVALIDAYVEMQGGSS